MRPQRREGWPERLAAMVEAARDVPFAWGSHDCCTWAARWVEAERGVSILAPFVYARGEWASALEAARIMQDAGGLGAIVTAELGVAMPAARAMRGDVVRVEIEGRESLAVVVGDMAAAPGLEGIAFAPMGRWLEGWAV
jgi:hypothetical protein